MEERRLRCVRPVRGTRWRIACRPRQLGPTDPRLRLRTRRDFRGDHRRHVGLGRARHDPRHGHRRIHRQDARRRSPARQRAAGMADCRDWRGRHPRRLSRHVASPSTTVLTHPTSVYWLARREAIGAVKQKVGGTQSKRRLGGNMAIRRLLSMAVGVVLVAACGASAPPTTAHTNWYIPIISKGWQHQFWVAVRHGAQDEATKEGVTINFIGPDNESQVDVQISLLQQELAKKPSALCFAALDGKADQPILQKYSDAKIPVIGFDS